MKKLDWHYPREELAETMLTGLYQMPSNRITLIDSRRTGKTQFLLRDMHDSALKLGLVPVYVNMWEQPEQPASALIKEMLAVIEIADNTENLASRSKWHLKKVDAGMKPFFSATFEPNLEAPEVVSEDKLTQLSDCFNQLIEAFGDKVVLMIDEVQHIAVNEVFAPLEKCLRTNFDTHKDSINGIFTGSSRTGINKMFNDDKKPFYRSSLLRNMEKLPNEFVSYIYDLLSAHYEIEASLNDFIVFFQEVDRSPFWMMELVNRCIAMQESFEESVSHVRISIEKDGDYIKRAKSLDAIDVVIIHYLLENSESGIYSKKICADFSEETKKRVTASIVQTRIKRLLSDKIVSVFDEKYLLETPGIMRFVNYER